MKTRLTIILITIFLILVNAPISYADTSYGIYLNIDPQEIKIGDTFTVTLSAKCNDGINGIDTTYTYDTDKLELVSAEVSDSKNWSSLGTDNQITVICNSTEKITEADIYILTFKVKENVTLGENIIISTTDILLDSDAGTDSEIMIDAKELSIKVISDEKEEHPTNPDDDTTVDSDDDKQNEEQNNITISTPGNVDNSVSAEKLPYTGINLIILLSIVVLTILTIVLYKINRKYKNI